MKTELEVLAQREIIQGYYTRIGFNPAITVEEIMQMLESDLNHLRSDAAVVEINDLLAASQSLPQQPDSIQELIVKIKQRMDLLPDDPVPSERAAYDAYLNCLNWAEQIKNKL